MQTGSSIHTHSDIQQEEQQHLHAERLDKAVRLSRPEGSGGAGIHLRAASGMRQGRRQPNKSISQ